MINSITGIGGWNGEGGDGETYYQAAPGLYAGDPNGIIASALVLCFGPTGIDQYIWSNIDGNGDNGWALAITSAGLIRASTFTGGAGVSVTYDSLGRLYNRWLLLTLTSDTNTHLWVNGTEVASFAGVCGVSNGSARIGVSCDTPAVAPFHGLIAGVTYTVGSGGSPGAYFTQVTQQGQLWSPQGFIAATIPASRPENVWQASYYNDSGHPPAGATPDNALINGNWQPQAGGSVLTLVRGVNAATIAPYALNLPAQWF